ncbi:MAG: c-type cytochrome [Synoicihabitans sp.]
MPSPILRRFTAASLILTGGFSFIAAADPIAGANGLELTEFATEPLVRNAVAVTVDEQNNVFATSVVRRQAADLDIRRFREWIETELSLTSVEQKRAWFKANLTPENSAKFQDRFEDHNGDGVWDFSDLSLLADQITRLTDTDGAGMADEFVKFNAAENSGITGIAAGLAAWDGALYATVEPDLVRLTDPDGDGVYDQREVLATGFSVKIGYGGHNFSGVNIGPDGRLYASVADRGMNVTDREGNNHYNPHSGAIIRCELDGSNFEIFAYGLRNAQEPAFDAYGNLIAVDNDGDFKGEKERLVYITEGSDTGWRTNWQYRGDDWLPWMDEGLVLPDHPEQPAYITPPLQLYKDGPAGFAFNPGTALNPFYRDHFFMTAFPSRNLYAFKLEQDGAGYRMVGEHTVLQSTLMVGVGWSPRGALYIADWSSSGYGMNEKGAVWKLDDPTQRDSVARTSTARLIAQDWSAEELASLKNHISHDDQRVRMKAQFEIVRRGESETLLKIARDLTTPQLGRLHAIWGLGQIHRSGDLISTLHLINLLNDADSEVRAQTAKIIGEGPQADQVLLENLRELLTDSEDRPRFFAAIALGKLRDAASVEPLVAYLDTRATDRFHRHAAVMGLAGCATAEQLAALADHANRQVRLGAVVALRRLSNPAVANFLGDNDALVVAEAASAIHDDESIEAALPDLAALLASGEELHERTLRRAMSAALRLRTPAAAKLVADYAANENQPRELRLHALALLNVWLAPAVLDTVEGRHRPLDKVTPRGFARSVGPSLAVLSKSADFDVARAAWEASSIFGIEQSVEDLLAIFRQDSPLSADALKQLDAMEASGLLELSIQATKSAHTNVRQQALRTMARISGPHFVAHAQPFIDNHQIPESRTAIELQSQSTEHYSKRSLRYVVSKFVAGELSPDLSLDIVEAARKSDDPRVQELITPYLESKDSSDTLSPYLETLYGGDPAQGQIVFETSVAAQCTLCHRVGRRGSNVGPALTKIGEKDARYLLEALVDPGATIAPGFGLTSVTLKSGESLAGNLMETTETHLAIKTPDGKTQQIALNDIAHRTPAMSSMPPMGAMISPFELRDLIAYLQTLK